MCTITDPLAGPETYFSYVAVFDTGSSGNVISATEANGRNLPTTGQTYLDQGIGGWQTFNVSQPTTMKISPIGVGYSGSEITANFTSYGNYKCELCQSDPMIGYPGYPGLSCPVETNTIGTPVLNQYVMHVQPNNTPIPYYDFFPVAVSYMQRRWRRRRRPARPLAPRPASWSSACRPERAPACTCPWSIRTSSAVRRWWTRRTTPRFPAWR